MPASGRGSAAAAACPATSPVADAAPAWILTVDADNCLSERFCEAGRDEVEGAVTGLLDLFDEHAIQATFFICSGCARAHPALVREVKRRGHEPACHGAVRLGGGLCTPAQFRSAASGTKHLLEDITGERVAGYRIAGLAMTNWTVSALAILAEQGFAYDSSVDAAARRTLPRGPAVIRTEAGPIVELPMSDIRRLPANLLCAGAASGGVPSGAAQFGDPSSWRGRKLAGTLRIVSSCSFRTANGVAERMLSDSRTSETPLEQLAPHRGRLWRYIHEVDAY